MSGTGLEDQVPFLSLSRHDCEPRSKNTNAFWVCLVSWTPKNGWFSFGSLNCTLAAFCRLWERWLDVLAIVSVISTCVVVLLFPDFQGRFGR